MEPRFSVSPYMPPPGVPPVFAFGNPEFGMVRTATDEKGEPWFCAKDLCDALGYKKL